MATPTPCLSAAPSRTTITVSPALRPTPTSCFAVEFVGRVSSTRCRWPCTRTCTRARPGVRFASASSVEVTTWRHTCYAYTVVSTRSVCSTSSRTFESDDDPLFSSPPGHSSPWGFFLATSSREVDSHETPRVALKQNSFSGQIPRGEDEGWVRAEYSLAGARYRWCKCLVKKKKKK